MHKMTQQTAALGFPLRGRSNETSWEKGMCIPGVDCQDCRLMDCAVRTIQVAAGDLLFQEGEHSHSIYFIKKGRVEVGRQRANFSLMDMGPYGFVDMDDDQPHWVTRETLEQGSCVGEECTLDGKPHYLTARMVGDGEVVELNAATIKSVLERHPHIRSSLRHLLLAA